MSESMHNPWIRDYFMDVAETFGAQLYNAPVSNKKKKVQLIDLLTYQENNYVWAWISDKKHKISVRISKDAVDRYMSTYDRSIIDSRFFLIFVSSFRPMFSPRPLGPNASGNTLTSHISLEINHVSSVGAGGHLFGDPHELESDDNVKEWVLGLRQDGGGGNVLKLRKQEPVQNKKASPSPFTREVSHDQPAKVSKNVVKSKLERSQDYKRSYAKRWRKIEIDRWKLTVKPAVEKEAMQIGPTQPPIEPLLDTKSLLESRLHEPLVCPTTPHRTPSPTRLQCQATPTDWSLSNRGSPVVPEEANTSVLDNGMQEHDEPGMLPPASHPPSDTDRQTTVDTVVTSDTHSLQPPTPAQRIKRSPIRHSLSPPETFACSPSRPSQQLPGLSPPPLSSSLPPPSSSLSIPMGIRRNIQRKVPHPGAHVPPPDPTKRGPVQVLVPNSDVSGTGSSQSHSQLPQFSQSQQNQSQLLSHSPYFPSAQSRPRGASTPGEDNPVDSTRRTSRMFARSSPIHRDGDEQDTISVDDKYTTGEADVDIGNQSESNLPSASNFPRMEALEEGKSYTQETGELQLARTVECDEQTGSQDTGEVGVNASLRDQLSADKVETRSLPRNTPAGQSLHLAATSVIHNPSVNADEIAFQSAERFGSPSPMHSLFSDSLADERRVPLHAPDSRTEGRMEDMAGPYVPGHDAKAWSEPSFMARNKRKGKAPAVKEPDIRSTEKEKRRQRSTEPESPRHKRARKTVSEVHQAALDPIIDHMKPEDTKASATPNTHQNDRGSSSHTDEIETTTELRGSKPRLANFVVDFERVTLGKSVPVPRLKLDEDMKSILLRTGRIRTLGEKVESDGSVYIMK